MSQFEHFEDYFGSSFSSCFKFALRFPFDTNNLTGYLIAVIAEYFFTLNLELFIMCIMIIAIGSCLILISLTKDMKCGLNALNESAVETESESQIQLFNELIEFHSNAKQLSESYSLKLNSRLLCYLIILNFPFNSQADSRTLKYNGILVCFDIFMGDCDDMQCNVDHAN